MMEPLKIAFLDHVAIRVADLERSADWYARVLGMERLQPEEWKPFPIFMVAGETGVAIFPLKPGQTYAPEHFAFRVDRENYDRALRRFEALGLDFEVQDHHYFLSVYLRDPDDHTVELTTPIRPLKA